MGAWMPRQIERVLPSETAAKVRKIREAHAEKVRSLWRAAREARGAMRAALDADPLDVAALRAAVTATRDADAALATETGAIIVEMAENLTAAERMLVREKIKDLRKQPRRVKGGDDRNGPPPPPDGDGPIGIPPGEMPEPPPEATPAPTP